MFIGIGITMSAQMGGGLQLLLLSMGFTHWYDAKDLA